VASLTFRLLTRDLDEKLRVNLLVEDGVVRSEVQRRARNVRDRARELAEARSAHSSGALPASIRYTTAELRGTKEVVAQVGSDLEHALWVEEGTGVFGPRGTPITPRSAAFLVFESEEFGRRIIASEVQGQPGKHYLRDALSAAGSGL
jgi:hypothetical protein